MLYELCAMLERERYGSCRGMQRQTLALGVLINVMRSRCD
jgi:hypothetical protein